MKGRNQVKVIASSKLIKGSRHTAKTTKSKDVVSVNFRMLRLLRAVVALKVTNDQLKVK